LIEYTGEQELSLMESHGNKIRNNLLKMVLKRHHRPVDVVNLSLLQLSIYFCNEIKLGFSNNGEFKLKPEYIENKTEKEHINLRTQYTLKEIVDEWIETESSGTESSVSTNSPLTPRPITPDSSPISQNPNSPSSSPLTPSPISPRSKPRSSSSPLRETPLINRGSALNNLSSSTTSSSTTSSPTIKDTNNSKSNTDDDETDPISEDDEPPSVVRTQPPATVKAIRAKEIANGENSCVFNEEKKIWLVKIEYSYVFYSSTLKLM
jgi:hypothetical protein